MSYYFAYGSNLNKGQMKKRCPASRPIGKAYLPDYKFVYDGNSKKWKGPVANIVPCENETVWGAVYEVTEECIKKLDSCEGYPNSYDRKQVNVVDENGKEYQCLVYLREALQEGTPTKEYKQIVIQGAKDFGLPADYINQYLNK